MNSTQQEGHGGGLPVFVFVALLPSDPDAEEANQPVPSEFQTSINRCNASGNLLCASEYTKYLVEYACPDRLLLPLMERANSSNGVLKLCYGCGFETIVVIGNANAQSPPTKHLSVGITASKANSTIRQVGDAWIPGPESVWSCVATPIRHRRSNNDDSTCLYVRTSNQRFMIPALPQEEIRKRRRMIRVYPDPDDPKSLEKMEEVPDPSALHAAAKKKKATKKKRATSTDETKEDEPPVPSKKKNKKKDPTKPKRAKTLYNVFMMENRGRIAREHPNEDFVGVNQLLVDEYKLLTDEQREQYEPLVEADRKRYDDEMKAWAAKQGDGSDTEEDEPAVKKKPKKDPLKPKHGKNAYNWFMEQNRERVKAANPDADYTTIRNTLNEEYRSLSETEKEKYTDLAKEDKLQQDKAIAEYEAELPEDDDDGTTAAKPKKKKKDANAPKHPKNAFLFFSKENRQAIKDANPTATFGEVGRLVGVAYHALGAEEKAKYEAMAVEDKERYTAEKEAYVAKNETGEDDDGSKKPAAKPPKAAVAAEDSGTDDDSTSTPTAAIVAAEPDEDSSSVEPFSSKKKAATPKSKSKKRKSSEAGDATVENEEEAAPENKSTTKKKKKKKKKHRKSESSRK